MLSFKRITWWVELKRCAIWKTPDWLIRAMAIQKSMIDRARRLSPKAAWAISVAFAIVFGLAYTFAAFLDPKAYSRSKPPE
jgi:hypothetical protein